MPARRCTPPQPSATSSNRPANEPLSVATRVVGLRRLTQETDLRPGATRARSQRTRVGHPGSGFRFSARSHADRPLGPVPDRADRRTRRWTGAGGHGARLSRARVVGAFPRPVIFGFGVSLLGFGGQSGGRRTVVAVRCGPVIQNPRGGNRRSVATAGSWSMATRAGTQVIPTRCGHSPFRGGWSAILG